MPATRTSTTRRRTRSSQPAVLDDLKKMVDVLLKENRTLKRQVAKLTEAGAAAVRPGRRANPVATGLAGLQRKLQRALDGSSTSSSRRSTSRRTAAAAAKPRKPVSPEVREKRLQALAKARAARAAKKAGRA